MGEMLGIIITLIARKEVMVSDHGYDELAADSISIRDIVAGVHAGTIVEEYPDYSKGPCILVRQWDSEGNPLHVVWGIPKGQSSPAVLVTAYRPDPEKWSENFLGRIK